MRQLPDAERNADMKHRDAGRTRRPGGSTLASLSDAPGALDAEETEMLEQSLFEPQVEPGKRTKKPYSTASLASLMLEMEYGT